jgi:hypothetical protein
LSAVIDFMGIILHPFSNLKTKRFGDSTLFPSLDKSLLGSAQSVEPIELVPISRQQNRVRVTLRLTVSESVCLGVEPPDICYCLTVTVLFLGGRPF